MDHNMNQMKATANAHMRRDMEAGRKWVCGCEECHQIRSLIGIEKTLDVRPLVRNIERVESDSAGCRTALRCGHFWISTLNSTTNWQM